MDHLAANVHLDMEEDCASFVSTTLAFLRTHQLLANLENCGPRVDFGILQHLHAESRDETYGVYGCESPPNFKNLPFRRAKPVVRCIEVASLAKSFLHIKCSMWMQG